MIYKCSKCGKTCYNRSNNPKDKPSPKAHGDCNGKKGSLHNWVQQH